MSMTWKIVPDGSRLTSGVQVEAEDGLLPLVAFFAELNPSRYPELIDANLRHNALHTEMSGIRFQENLDEEDELDGLSFGSEEMLIYNHMSGDIIFQTKEFAIITVAFLTKFIEIQTGGNKYPGELLGAIKANLPTLDEG
ncbi:MAG: hypothetical protein U0176_20730 [Bacteroidia bacterium]